MDELTRQSFIARQPIFNPDLSLHGYELLFRQGHTGSAQFEDADQATTQVIIGAYLDHGLENIVGSLPAFINVGSEFFRGNYPLPMRTEQVVLEVLESVPPEAEIVEALRQLKAQGYRIALDHFVYREALEPFLALADYVKLDTLVLDEAALALEVEHVRRQSKARLIAAKVETEALHTLCKQLGFDYFQGYFFSRPEVVEKQAAEHNRVLILKLLGQLQQEETDPGELEQIIVQDVALSYRLLRYINCATFALRREVDSIRQAILLLGLDAIRKWATLLLLSNISGNRPHALVVMGMVRAQMCQRLAEEQEGLDPQQAFTAGLFSVADAIMGLPMSNLLDQVPLAVPIKLALDSGEGPLGRLLQSVIAYEQGEWERLAQLGVDAERFSAAYLEAIRWADENGRVLQAA